MPTDAPLLNYTTKVPASRTLQEMQTALARAGARRVMVEFDAEGDAAGLAFTLHTPHGERLYSLPCDVDAVLRILTATDPRLMKASKVKAERAQAERVAWRVLKDWLEAQLALVRTRMATLDQVMLPYVHIDQDRTLYAAWADNEARALPGGQS